MRLANGRMTRTAGAVLAGVMALSLAGCGGSAPVQESSAPKQETQAQTEAQAAAGGARGTDDLDGKLVGGSDPQDCRSL